MVNLIGIASESLSSFVYNIGIKLQQCYKSIPNKGELLLAMTKLYSLTADSNWKKYQSKRAQTVRLYNESCSSHSEEPEIDFSEIKKPSLLHYFGIKGEQGGILVEQLMNNESYALITFAALPKAMQGIGLGTKLVEFATQQLKLKSVRLVGAQLNHQDSHAFWLKQGFTEVAPLENGIALIIPE
ncbi:GNAT family N-acetyltransferase [Vibrio gangliei]|uniref:GNAT family N-acetyltransferase n=1 Tax=Vibrio gangliei TaxID=2077090 RepID=UPI000D01A039|nr:GNAT family N-acetyltransferase [Vibrio gangliei]